MRNFDIEYDLAKIYSDIKKSEPEDKKKLLTPPPKTDSNIAYIIINNDFDNLCSPSVASK